MQDSAGIQHMAFPRRKSTPRADARFPGDGGRGRCNPGVPGGCNWPAGPSLREQVPGDGPQDSAGIQHLAFSAPQKHTPGRCAFSGGWGPGQMQPRGAGRLQLAGRAESPGTSPRGRPARQRRYPTLGFFRAAKAHPGPMRVFRGMGAGADATQGCRAAAAGRQGRVSGNKSRGTACKTAPGSNTWCTAPAPGAVGCAFNNARIELKIGASCSHGDSPTI